MSISCTSMHDIWMCSDFYRRSVGYCCTHDKSIPTLLATAVGNQRSGHDRKRNGEPGHIFQSFSRDRRVRIPFQVIGAKSKSRNFCTSPMRVLHTYRTLYLIPTSITASRNSLSLSALRAVETCSSRPAPRKPRFDRGTPPKRSARTEAGRAILDREFSR